eukprot:sb/3475325/
MGGRRRTFKLYLQPFSRYLALKVLKIGRFLLITLPIQYHCSHVNECGSDYTCSQDCYQSVIDDVFHGRVRTYKVAHGLLVTVSEVYNKLSKGGPLAGVPQYKVVFETRHSIDLCYNFVYVLLVPNVRL